MLMIQINSILCMICLYQLAQSQSNIQMKLSPLQHQFIAHYPTNYKLRPNTNAPIKIEHTDKHVLKEAEDRQLHWIKLLKKKRKKLKQYKKHFNRCGSPYQFKLFRKSDDGNLDRVKITLPYGYDNEYFPRPVEANSNETDSISETEIYKPPPVHDSAAPSRPEIPIIFPLQHHFEEPTRSFAYSVKYNQVPFSHEKKEITVSTGVPASPWVVNLPISQHNHQQTASSSWFPLTTSKKHIGKFNVVVDADPRNITSNFTLEGFFQRNASNIRTSKIETTQD